MCAYSWLLCEAGLVFSQAVTVFLTLAGEGILG
jgi:hypothetical protein